MQIRQAWYFAAYQHGWCSLVLTAGSL